GLQALYDALPHMILVNVILPDMDGYEILQKKAAEPLLVKIPVLLISTQGTPINMQKVPQGAVTEFIFGLHADTSEILNKVNKTFGYETVVGETGPVNKKKVVWMEDDKLIETILKKKFIASGFDLYHVKDGAEALEVLKTTTPDVVVLDLMVPGINGFELLQKIKMDPRLKKVPTMILSNLNKQSDIDRAKMLGADKFLVKAAASLDQIVEEVRAM
nr:response regulator [bacterium]